MVDDTPTNVRLLSDLLISRGYEVREALNGPTALAMVKANPPDMILLDIFMPDMDGYQVCELLKADPNTRDIPVIFISALSDVDNIVKGFEVGGVDYVTKPFKFREVLARVATHLMLVEQRREIQALRQQDRESFASLNKMKDEFISMATHDLRNPLNVILGYAGVLDRLDVADQQKELLDDTRQAIRQNVQKMRTLVTDILDMAQVKSMTGLETAPVPLGAFLQECLNGFRVIAQQKNITLKFDPPAEDVQATLNRHYMARVVDNLVSNAIKYTPSAGCVTLSVQNSAAQVTIQIVDTGIGISADDLPHLFDAFYRVSHVQHEDIEGSGLGLSIVKTIVEKHGGQITVTSTPGQGSTFCVILSKG
jgi:signal transduction histidine kinase